MPQSFKLGQSADVMTFLLVSSSDHITPVTGLGTAPLVGLSKNGGAFAAPDGGVVEVGNGWYKVSADSDDFNTLGALVLHATGAGADPADRVFQVVAFDPRDSNALGLARLDIVLSSIPALVVTAMQGLGTYLKEVRDGLLGRYPFLDKLNFVGSIATGADINALNQSAARRIMLTVLQTWEIPETGSNVYSIELRLWDPDGAAVDPTGALTLTVTGTVSGSLAANLSGPTNVSTGVRRWTYTLPAGAISQEVQIDASAVLADGTYTMRALTQTADLVAAVLTAQDKTNMATAAANSATIMAKTSLLPSVAAGSAPNALALVSNVSGGGGGGIDQALQLMMLLALSSAQAKTVTGVGPDTLGFTLNAVTTGSIGKRVVFTRNGELLNGGFQIDEVEHATDTEVVFSDWFVSGQAVDDLVQVGDQMFILEDLGAAASISPSTPVTDLDWKFELLTRQIDKTSVEYVRLSATAIFGIYRNVDPTQYAAEIAIGSGDTPNWEPAVWDATGVLKAQVGPGTAIGTLLRGNHPIRVRLSDDPEYTVIQVPIPLHII